MDVSIAGSCLYVHSRNNSYDGQGRDCDICGSLSVAGGRYVMGTTVLFVSCLLDVGAACTLYDRLVGLVVKVSASRAKGPGFESRLRRDFFGVESYQ